MADLWGPNEAHSAAAVGRCGQQGAPLLLRISRDGAVANRGRPLFCGSADTVHTSQDAVAMVTEGDTTS